MDVLLVWPAMAHGIHRISLLFLEPHTGLTGTERQGVCVQLSDPAVWANARSLTMSQLDITPTATAYSVPEIRLPKLSAPTMPAGASTLAEG